MPVDQWCFNDRQHEQAIERSGTKKQETKGSEAALTAIEMVNLLKAI